MKANEFVRKFGWEYAKERMEYCKGARLVGMEIDLERLVVSWELVESKGGLDAAKHIVKSQHNLYTDMRLAQAIADVESCMEGV